MGRVVTVGSRGSALALEQTRQVVVRLKKLFPELNFRVEKIQTTGDNILDVALAKIGDKGLFTKEIEKALLDGQIDIAVHSMKDLPTKLPEGLAIGAILEREDPGDVLISRHGKKLEEFEAGARIGTSSLRRTAQINAFRSDLEIVSVRGNVQTRLRKLEEGKVDAIVLAWAGVSRLGLAGRVTQRLSFAVCLPAVGQGALGVEVREDDTDMMEKLKRIDHADTRAAVLAERALLKCLEGGCQIPIGALARVWDGDLVLEGLVASLDGKKIARAIDAAALDMPEELGQRLAEKLLSMGAKEILQELREGGRAGV
ncbi:MAG: hydroxymethylbilane synthase [Clostridia bacterium]|nr:hydroxymethylbilane synthase [Clostridia bacterium]MDQ7792533.1 hydroxymethylbilane synthase [Clostridia bacterium]